MQITVLKSKIHKVTVTECHLNYDGSCAIDRDLLSMSGIHEHEQIHIYNLNNGERFVTYAIRAEKDDTMEPSMMISLRGAAARRGVVGDELIICSYGQISDSFGKEFKPTIIAGNLYTRGTILADKMMKMKTKGTK